MLKIEKTARNHHLEIFFRLKNRRFDRTFFKALTWALSIHILGLILFSVNPFNLGKERILSPTVVEADLNLPNTLASNAFAQLEGEGQNSHIAPLPAWQPTFPEMPLVAIQSQFESIKEKNSANPFISIEYDPENILFSTKTLSLSPLVQMHISGELAQLQLLEKHASNLAAFSKSLDQFKAFRTVYALQVEGRSGKVLWYAPLELTQNEAINQFTETVVANLRFEKDQDKFVNSGEIEIFFNTVEMSN